MLILLLEGITKTKLDKEYKGDVDKILPVLLHGDSFGQGVVYEVIQMYQLDGYQTGGTIHIAVNNQVGFTTNYHDVDLVLIMMLYQKSYFISGITCKWR